MVEAIFRAPAQLCIYAYLNPRRCRQLPSVDQEQVGGVRGLLLVRVRAYNHGVQAVVSCIRRVPHTPHTDARLAPCTTQDERFIGRGNIPS